MKSKKLPTPKKSLLLLSVALFTIGIFIYLGPEFSELERNTIRRFGQAGLLLTYVGALLGLHSLFWDDAFSAARTDAQNRITLNQAKLDILQDLESSLPPEKLQASKDYATDSLRDAREHLNSANSQPAVRIFEGWAGVVLIVLGTTAQFVGLG